MLIGACLVLLVVVLLVWWQVREANTAIREKQEPFAKPARPAKVSGALTDGQLAEALKNAPDTYEAYEAYAVHTAHAAGVPAGGK